MTEYLYDKKNLDGNRRALFISGMKISDPINEALLRQIHARMFLLGISRKDLSRITGISISVINGTLGGFTRPGNGARRLIEVALGAPIWSTQDEFRVFTQFLNRPSPAITADKSNQKSNK